MFIPIKTTSPHEGNLRAETQFFVYFVETFGAGVPRKEKLRAPCDTFFRNHEPNPGQLK